MKCFDMIKIYMYIVVWLKYISVCSDGVVFKLTRIYMCSKYGFSTYISEGILYYALKLCLFVVML